MIESKHNRVHPEDWADHTTIWKYMDLYSLLGLVTSEQLVFTNLPEFDDQYEGRTPMQDEASLVLDFVGQVFKQKDYRQVLRDKERREEKKKETFANSWRISKDECFLMWQTYGSSRNGIAIKSSPASLMKAIQPGPDDVYFGTVKYIDYVNGSIGDRPDIEFSFHKQLGYSSEQEFRACIVNDAYPQGSKQFLSVDAKVLIEKIYISPWGAEWQITALKETLQKLGFDKIPVQRSRILGVGGRFREPR